MGESAMSAAAKDKGLDAGQLLPPMHTSRRGLQQVLDLFRNATPSLKQLLLQEADIIYECRVCKGLFRGLVNFIEHKRSFCKMRSGIDHHVASKAAGLNFGDLYHHPNEDAAAPQVEPQPPTRSPVNERGMPKRSTVDIPVINDQSSSVGNSDAFLILRPIPSTSEAIEQQVVRSDHIVHHDELEKLSIFTPRQQGDDTSKIVGEIAIRQAAKGKGSITKRVEKREALHNILKNVGGKEVSAEDTYEKGGSIISVLPKGKATEGGNKVVSPKQPPGVVMLQMSSSQQGRDKNQQVPCQPTECTICKKKCKNWTALAWHMRIHKRPVFKCSICRYSSASVYNLRRHMQTMHHLPTTRVDELLSRKVEQQKALHENREKADTKEGETSSSSVPTCDICFKTFANRRNVLRHKEIHRREQSSPDMNRGNTLSPSQEEIARAKVLQIMDEKNLKCRRCQKQLATMRRLQQHCCNHFGFNRYRCKLCPYENNDYTQMRRHMMGKHGRQFRTIYQISEAIRNMKIGIWVNLVQYNNNSRSEDESIASASPSSTASPVKLKVVTEKTTPVKARNDTKPSPKKKELNDNPDQNGVDHDEEEDEDDDGDGGDLLMDDDDKEDDENMNNEEEGDEEDGSVDDGDEKMEYVEEEKVNKGHPSHKKTSKNAKSQSNKENKSAPKTPTKQQQHASSASKEGQLTPPTNTSSRKSPEPTPSRDMPIRQARLNHQSVSPRNQPEKTQGEKPAPERVNEVRRNLNAVKRDLGQVKRELSKGRESARESARESGRESKGGKEEVEDEDKNTLELMMDKRLVRCLNCNKRYQYLSSLQRHVRIHLLRGETDIRPSPSKNYADSSKKHQAIDALINANLLKCLKCRKRFESMSSLKRHVARHLGYSSFKCKFCGYLSRNYTWFKQHLQMKHSEHITDPGQMGVLMGSMKTKK